MLTLVSDSVKADIFGFDITDVSASIRLFSDVMKRLGIKLDGAELYEKFQRIYDRVLAEILIKIKWKIRCGICGDKYCEMYLGTSRNWKITDFLFR